MDDCERMVFAFLSSLGIGPVVYEPDGNVPPDFLLAARIAVEARRLNEHEEVDGTARGLEVTAKPLHQAVVKALDQSGPPSGAKSWYVHYTVRRPLPPWKVVEKQLRSGVQEFRDRLDDPPGTIRLGRSLSLRFLPAGRTYERLLVLGSSSDHDAGGFLVAELTRNLEICIAEKARKVSRVRHRYSEWWLVFEDRIGYGALEDDDVAQLRAALKTSSGFSKVVLVNPLDPRIGIEVQPDRAA